MGDIRLSHLCRNSNSSPRRNLEVEAQIEVLAVTKEQGPYRLHTEAHTAPLSIFYIKHNLKTNHFFLQMWFRDLWHKQLPGDGKTALAALKWGGSAEPAGQHFSADCKILAKISTFQLNNCIWIMIYGRLYMSFDKESQALTVLGKYQAGLNCPKPPCHWIVQRCCVKWGQVFSSSSKGVWISIYSHQMRWHVLQFASWIKMLCVHFSPFQLIGMCLCSPKGKEAKIFFLLVHP